MNVSARVSVCARTRNLHTFEECMRDDVKIRVNSNFAASAPAHKQYAYKRTAHTFRWVCIVYCTCECVV